MFCGPPRNFAASQFGGSGVDGRGEGFGPAFGSEDLFS
jgi:hypothetical protein